MTSEQGNNDSKTFSYETFTGRNLGFVSRADQKRLREAHVFIAGVGGMGGAAVACLARSGIGRFTIADIDMFEVSNLNRQMFATLDTVGADKAQTTRAQVLRINPTCQITVLGREWPAGLPSILPAVDVAINGCDDVRATLALMRQGRAHGRAVVDAFAATLPNVYVVGPNDPRPEELLLYPTVGVPLDRLSDEMVAGCKQRELEWVLTHSNTANHVELDVAAEMMTGARPRISFAPMVWMTGCLMAYEALRIVLGRTGGPGPGGWFMNPWTGAVERPHRWPWASVRRFFVRRFMAKLGQRSGS